MIQLVWKQRKLGYDAARFISTMHLDEEDLESPDLGLAAEAAKEDPPRDAAGNLYSLRSPLAIFDTMGMEVSVYMRFIVYVGRAAGVARCSASPRSSTTPRARWRRTAASPPSRFERGVHAVLHGVVELLTSTVLVCFCFWMRTAMFSTTERIHDHTAANQLLSAANFSVMVDRVPADCEHAELRRHFETFGAVVHIGVSRANRPLVLHLHRRATLQRAVQAAAVELVARVRSAREPSGRQPGRRQGG